MTGVEWLGIRVVAIGCVVVGGLGLWALSVFARAVLTGLRPGPFWWRAAIASAAAAAIGVGCFLYGWLIETNRLTTTFVEVETSKLPAGERLRIVQLSDTHVIRERRPVNALADAVNALEPDLVVFTGDAANSRDGVDIFRATVSSLRATHGRFAVQGNHDTALFGGEALFGGGVATELRGQPVEIADGVHLCGMPYGQGRGLGPCVEAAGADGLTIVVFHTPDRVEALAPLEPDLYLAGHTHGGQVRVPFYGAVITLSAFGKRYEMGRYQVEDTVLFVSRGIGVEPPPAPRVRFLSPPEIAVIDLVGTRR